MKDWHTPLVQREKIIEMPCEQRAITAELTAGGLKIIRLAPLPGDDLAPSLPDWRKDSFKRHEFLHQMREAAKHLK